MNVETGVAINSVSTNQGVINVNVTKGMHLVETGKCVEVICYMKIMQIFFLCYFYAISAFYDLFMN